METSRTPLIIVLVVLIAAAVGFLIGRVKGQAGRSQSQQRAIQASQQGPPGTFTPAPR
jgi:hypothetical protein